MDGKSNDDSLDKSLQEKCVVDDSEMEIVGVMQNDSSSSTSTLLMASAMTEAATSSVSEAICPQQLRKTDTNSSDDSATLTAITTSNSSSSDNGLSASPDSTPTPCGSNFEKKVKQIAKDLKQTTLSESTHADLSLSSHNAGVSTVTTSSASSSSSSSSSSGSSTLSTTPEDEETIMLPREDDENTLAGDRNECFEAESLGATNMDHGHSDAVDERLKKVRFHPDAKANDGGNRVRKKRFKTKATNIDGAASGAGANSEECSMDLDEDDYEDDDEEYDENGMDTDGDVNINDGNEEDEEFNLERTIAEAEDYLKEHPLTFASPNELTGERLRNGLLNIEDMPHFGDSSEDEDLYDNVLPENNVQRVLGKQIKGGKVEFLLRYSDRPGLFWESEEFIQQKCPGMLMLYERHREHQQERLMRHVAKRQNLRQRYTDF